VQFLFADHTLDTDRRELRRDSKNPKWQICAEIGGKLPFRANASFAPITDTSNSYAR
jgi:hypothetical protein